MKEFERLVKVVQKLRDPDGGCPWDLEQTHESLLKYLIEESYEFIHATETQDFSHMEEELGDVLLQILLHTTIAQESQKFNLESVSKRLADKLIYRHPHVFKKAGEAPVDAAWVESNWEKMKAQEKAQAHQNQKKSRIDDAYLHFPALFSAHKIGKKTAKLGFDWSDASEVIDKVQEEWEELKVEIKRHTMDKSEANQAKIAEEMGDFLFSMAQLSRHLGHDAEETLRLANKKFLKRFQMMEELIEKAGVELESLNQKEMDHYWDQVKALQKLKPKK